MLCHSLIGLPGIESQKGSPITSDDKNAAEFEAMFDMVRARYGDRLNDSELERVRSEVETVVDLASTLRDFDLKDWDQPSSAYSVYRGEA